MFNYKLLEHLARAFVLPGIIVAIALGLNPEGYTAKIIGVSIAIAAIVHFSLMSFAICAGLIYAIYVGTNAIDEECKTTKG